uniref:OSJNBa0018J19.7 protein n=1 Tax=Oryza sativa subsp. japonica TaxID=39947 RepID=Q7XMV1_ORYSJ|nr:OSJNBa0018J19.7 [Oryza sativa Japonica Group]
MSKDPPAEAENGTSTTSELEKDSNAAKPCRSNKNHEPTRITSEATMSWCPIHKIKKHTLQACSVFLNVRAEIHACKEGGIQRISPTCDVYCPIHKTKNHDLSSCKVFLSAMKTSYPKVQQPGISLRDEDKEQETLVSDRFVGIIDIDSHEPSVLHLLEDYVSSPTSTPREVLAIDGTSTSAHANAEAQNQVTTPAQHLRTINAILRETPYDPVLNDDLTQWTERLRESVTNLNNAFEETAAAAHPKQPPTGGINGENLEQRESPHRATPPPRGAGDLRDHLNGHREARRTRDNGNRSQHRVSSRHRDNEEREGRSNEDRDRANHHNRRDHDDRERRTQGDTGRGHRHNDENDRERRRDNNGGRRQDSREPSRRPHDALRRKNDKPKTGGEKKPATDAPESSKKKNRKSGKKKAQAEVLAAEYANPPKRPDPQDCLVFKKSLEKHMASEKGKRVHVVEKDAEAAAQESDSAYPDSDLHVSHIFGGSTAYSSKREYKKVEREVCSTWQGAAPKMKWSEQKIEFLEEDHPKTAVIVEPTIRNIKVAWVLIDGGSSINLLFASTLDAMGNPQSEMTPTDQPFHGITPQSSSKQTTSERSRSSLMSLNSIQRIMPSSAELHLRSSWLHLTTRIKCLRCRDRREQSLFKGTQASDQLVDSTAGCELLSFLDAYSGYHQIMMAKENEEKTTFITPFGVFCYVKMPFGLITTGNTFQRTVQGALSDQLGNNVEA